MVAARKYYMYFERASRTMLSLLMIPSQLPRNCSKSDTIVNVSFTSTVAWEGSGGITFMAKIRFG